MAIVIQTNVGSLQAQENLASTRMLPSASNGKRSTGYRTNTAKDDAAGLAISESPKSQVRLLTVAERNADDAASRAQTAEGALGEDSTILVRLPELATPSATGALQSSDRSFVRTEFTNPQAEMDRVTASTRFTGQQLYKSAADEVGVEGRIDRATDERVGRLNLSVANRRIRDVDVAQDAEDQSRDQLLLQVRTSVHAQAKQSPPRALSLLTG